MEDILLHNNRDVELNESLVKYLAGLLDADGTISFDFRNESRDNGRATIGLKVGIAGSDSVDVHGFIESLPTVTGHGHVTRHGNNKQYVYWMVTSRRDLEMIVPRLLKHMCVKARHMRRMLEKWRELRGISLSKDDCERLREFSKQSRYDSGPLKPKNHPAFAWCAGYLDGNGHYQFSVSNSGKITKAGRETRSMRVSACCHKGDADVLNFLMKAFGGQIKKHNLSDNAMIWSRNIGPSQRSFALTFLGKMARFSKLKKHRIEQMIAFHHQQRLSESGSADQATV